MSVETSGEAVSVEIDKADSDSSCQVSDHVDDEAEAAYLTGWKLVMIVISLQLTNVCIAIDVTIIATSIPRISNTFRSLGDVGWYVSAYLLFIAAFQLFFGRLYAFLNKKWLFISCIFLFEVGSLVAATAPNSAALTAGRAITGFSASGIFTGCLTTLSTVVPLHKRGLFIGLVTAVYGIGSILGPLIGGALTDHVTWRWCFYINLPLGGFTIFILIFFLHFPKSPVKEHKDWKEYIMCFDPLGTILFAPSIICLLLALQQGGTTYKWSDGRIVALLVVFAVLMLGFAMVQVYMGDHATLNKKVVFSRHTACAVLYSLCVSASYFVMTYFIPIWFQAIQGVSAVRSGTHLLPFIISNIVSITSGGWLCSKIGWYNPFMFAPITLGTVGAGLIYTWGIDTPMSKIIGHQILYGVGVGLGQQQAIVAVQAGSKDLDIPSGIALLCFAENFGGAVFVSVAHNLWANKLAKGLQAVANINAVQVVNSGATEITNLTSDPATLRAIRVAYKDALARPFLVAIILLCVASIGTFGVDWKNIKPKEEKAQDDENNKVNEKPEGEEKSSSVEKTKDDGDVANVDKSEKSA
ncbi:MFS general substrate transporter [Venturia nashicola]|uniref:MFS general substrate transporter n=1 Tax=Venturia nashicola TaxID=86259 RepID=A0A4Z1NUK6_9PEZI|nr:MFS general substrate transporter [Venturia nashicola]TLD30088.1 MFS general substrate transporter [Venturia nashicola]